MNRLARTVIGIAALTVLVGAAHAAPLVNVGLGGKDTSASPQGWGGSAANAVDGNLGGTSWVHSAAAGVNFWEIDLGGTIPLTQFTVHARSGFLGRVNGSVISFLDHTGSVIDTHTVNVFGGTTDSVSFLAPLEARTVRMDKTSDYMNFMEIELFAENFALGAGTSQSSVWSGFSPSGVEATDGNLGNNTHTATGDPLPTLTVDLGKDTFSIDSIILHNRDSCCQGRLSDLVVEVLDSTMAVVQSAVVNPGDALGGPPTLGVDLHELFGGPATGQFIRISKTGDVRGEMWLSLGEVQVFGQDNDNPPPAALGFQNPTAFRSQPNLEVGYAVDGLVGSGYYTGWGDNAGAGDNTAVFETTADIDAGEQTLMTFTLDHQSFSQHGIGKFRISATTADRSQFADGQANNGQLGAAAIWTPVQVIDAEASGGSTFEVQPDGSVLVGGPNPSSDLYTVRALTDLRGITGIRLEALEDPALPHNGAGRKDVNGNFVLTEFSAWAQRTPDVLPVGLQNPTADKSQSGHLVYNLVTDNGVGWAAHDGISQGTPQTAAFETMADAGIDGGTLLTLDMNHRSPWGDHNVGKFRIAVTTADRSQFADGQVNGGDLGDPSIWTVLRPVDVVSDKGAVFTVADDGSILASGPNPGNDRYTVRAITNLTGITGVRLETLADSSLPLDGPGRGSNGNYVLTHVGLDQRDLSQPVPIGLQNPTADKSQPSWSVHNILTDNTAGWAAIKAGDSTATPQTAVVETMGDAGFDDGTTLTFQMKHDYFGSAHTIGEFRLSATTADRSQFADGLDNGGDLGDPSIWTELVPLSVVTSGQAAVTINPDNTVLLRGANPIANEYTVTLNTTMTGITGFRLETLADPSLPQNGPGRASNGNYVMTYIAASETPLGAQAVNMAQAAGVKVVGASSAVNPPTILNDGVTTNSVGTSSFINPPLAPQGVGYDLGGFASVDSIRIYQHAEVGGGGARRRLETVRVHTSAGAMTFSGLPDQDVIDLNLGGVESAYVFIEPVAQYGNAPDPQLGLREVQVFTRGLGIIPWPNVAQGKPATLVGSGWCCGSASDITDGITWWGPDLGNTATSVYNNAFSPTNGFIDIDLGIPYLVDRMGLVQMTYGGGGARDMIENIELLFSNDPSFASILKALDVTLLDGVAYQQVTFEATEARYVRINPWSQYLAAPDHRIGITEIQLFLAPEPATLSLLGLGALALLARRRRRG